MTFPPATPGSQEQQKRVSRRLFEVMNDTEYTALRELLEAKPAAVTAFDLSPALPHYIAYAGSEDAFTPALKYYVGKFGRPNGRCSSLLRDAAMYAEQKEAAVQ